MNSISIFIGQKLGLCSFPSTAPIARDKNDPLNKKIAAFFYYYTNFNVEAFFGNTLCNDRVFYQLISQSKWDLAIKFYKENPGINLSHTEDSPSLSSLSITISAVEEEFKNGPIKESLETELGLTFFDKGKLYNFLELILEKDDTINLFQEMPWPRPHRRVLDFLVHTNQLKLVHKFIENLMSRGEVEDRARAKKIFIAIKDLLEKEQADPRYPNNFAAYIGLSQDLYEKGLSMWSIYLCLLKETYKEAFSEIEFENLFVNQSAKGINYLIKRRWLPAEIYEKIALTILLNEKGCPEMTYGRPRMSYESALLKTLIDAQESLVKLLPVKFNLEPKVSKETLIKLTTLSFLAFQENSKVMLDNQQKKQCFRLIDRAILKNGSIFNSEIKERIVSEIGRLDHFSKGNIKKALERAFN